MGWAITAFGQATSLTKEEFDKETDKAFKSAKATFPRRETFVRLTFDESRITEFLAKDRIRYESKITIPDGGITLVTKRIYIGSDCYEMKKEKWVKDEFNCESRSGSGSGLGSESIGWAKEKFSVKNDKLDSKSVKVFRSVETGRSPSSGEPPYVVEYLYYVDSAGRLLKREYLTRRGEGKAKLSYSTTYEYDVKIAPINLPATMKKD